MKRIVDFFRQEPERAFFVVRSLLLILVALGVGLSNDMIEMSLAVLAAVLGLDFAATQRTHNTVYGADEALGLVQDMRTASALPSDLWDFVLGMVKSLLPAAEVPFAMAKLAGELAQFADQRLSPETKADITRHVHSTLRRLGYLKGRDFPPSSVLLLFSVLALALSACIPVANMVVSDRAAELSYAETGVVFNPGPVAAYDVLIDLQGDELVYLGEDEACEPSPSGLQCTAAEVVQAWLIEITGWDVTAVAKYAREPSGRSYLLLPQ